MQHRAVYHRVVMCPAYQLGNFAGFDQPVEAVHAGDHAPEARGRLFGAGLVIGGWCPGTALVGLASGRVDALVFLVGGMAGSLLFAALFPALRGFVTSGSCGVVTLPESFGLSPTLITGLVLAMALGAFAAVERFGPRDTEAAS